MMITVKFFAIVRERLGLDAVQIDPAALPSPTVAALMDHLAESHPELGPLRAHLRVAVDHQFVDEESSVEDGAEVALIPPVSGGSSTLSREDGRYLIGLAPLETTSVVDFVRRPDAGAVVTFEGCVRNHTDDHDVDYLTYEAYPEMALEKLIEVGETAADRWDASVAIHHRYGRLEVGDIAVVIAVSTPHRADGYACSQWIIDRLKEEVPIWKKEVGPDGSTWVGMGP